MLGIGEHVHGLDAADAVAALTEQVQVTGKGLRVAGDVDNAPGRGFQQGSDKAPVAAGAGRKPVLPGHLPYSAGVAAASPA